MQRSDSSKDSSTWASLVAATFTVALASLGCSPGGSSGGTSGGDMLGSMLESAAMSCAVADVQKLLSLGANPNAEAGGFTPLVAAADYCRDQQAVEVAQLLLDRGAAVDLRGALNSTALCEAASKRLGREVGDLNPQESFEKFDSSSPLVDLLISKGADVNAKCEDYGEQEGWTPLMRAAKMGTYGEPTTVKALVNAGADVNYFDKNGTTPLMVMAKEVAQYGGGPRMETIVEFLVGKGADINARDNDGNTPLKLIRSKGPSLATKELPAVRAWWRHLGARE